MKRRTLLTALLLLVPAVALGADAVVIEGPDQIAVGAAELFTVTGLASWKDVELRVLPDKGANAVRMKDADDKPLIYLKAPKAGTIYLLLIDYTKKRSVTKQVDVGGSTPNPPDPPGPKPPAPGAKYQVVFLFERSQLDDLPLKQKSVISSLTFRKEIVAKGHRFLAAWDKDAVGKDGTVPAEYAPWFRAASAVSLPAVLLAPIDGGNITAFPMPADEAATMALIEKGGL